MIMSRCTLLYDYQDSATVLAIQASVSIGESGLMSCRCALLRMKVYDGKANAMARVRIGDVAPELILKDVEGAPVSLATMWGNGRHALLIFLRHLA